MLPARKSQRPPTQHMADDEVWSVIGPGAIIRGELLLAGHVILYGRVEGTLFVDGDVRVASGGMVEGGIYARHIVVEGSCRGRIEGTREVIVKCGAVVNAEIYAGILTVEEGARVQEHPLSGSESPRPRILPFKRESPGHA